MAGRIRLQRHEELIAKIGDAMSRGVITDWSRERTATGWRWTLETSEGPWCLTFKRGRFTTGEAERLVVEMIETHRVYAH